MNPAACAEVTRQLRQFTQPVIVAPMPASQTPIDAFITRWEKATGNERANNQLFLTQLCALLGLPQPEPASEDICHGNLCAYQS